MFGEPRRVSQAMLSSSFDRRSLVVGGLQAGIGVLLAVRMGWIAIFQNRKYELASESNRVNLSLIPPRRGWILDRKGAPLAVFDEAPEALRAFGEAAPGRDSGLIETRAGGYFFLRVDAVTPSQKRPFAAVRDEVAAQWQRERRDAAARARAEEIAREWREGADPAALAASVGATVQPTPAMRRDGRVDNVQQRVPAPIAARLFQLKQGEVGTAALGDGYFVLKLLEIQPADPVADTANVKRLSDTLAQSIGDEIGQQYVRALRERLRVVIDPESVDRLYQN